jgi:allophanate hydrolase subunit 2
VAEPPDGEVVLTVLPGPRRDWFDDEAWSRLTTRWEVTSESNRVGLRLSGDPLPRTTEGELPSEGMVRGAVQVPPSGLPVLFLADSPVTGGYPVIAYLADEDVDLAAQLRPGQGVRLR